MRILRLSFCIGVAVAVLSGCPLFDGPPDGGGGGGNENKITFNKGFVYVRKDDRNLYITDESDFLTPNTLTTSGGVQTPSLSADGRRAVYVTKTGTDTAIVSVLTAGGTPSTLLASDATRKNFRHPVFSPDGQTVAFSYEEGLAGAIGLVNVDGSNFRKLIGGGALSYALPCYTPDGTAIIAAAGNGVQALSQLERITVSTGLATSVTNTLGNEATTISNRLAVSPDGTKATFDARVSSGVTRVFAIDLSSKAVTKLNEYTGEPGTNDSSPTWYSNSVVAFSSDSGGNDNIYRVSSTGTERRLLVAKAIEPWYGPTTP